MVHGADGTVAANAVVRNAADVAIVVYFIIFYVCVNVCRNIIINLCNVYVPSKIYVRVWNPFDRLLGKSRFLYDWWGKKKSSWRRMEKGISMPFYNDRKSKGGLVMFGCYCDGCISFNCGVYFLICYIASSIIIWNM